jgi:uncharacterized membrane protein
LIDLINLNAWGLVNFLLTILILITVVSRDLYASPKYEISDLGIAQSSQAFCINNKGEVAGTILIGHVYYVFRWSDEEGISILFESDGESIRGINELGQIVGNDSSNRGRGGALAQSPQGGYFWSPNLGTGSLARLVKLGFHACGINDLGIVCGCTYEYSDPKRPQPALYIPLSGLSIIDPVKELGYKIASFRGHIVAINALGTMVGDGEVLFQQTRQSPLRKKHHGFLKYSDGSLIDLGGHRPVDLNEKNQILLGSFPHQFIISVWDNGTFKELWKGGFSTLPTRINNNGDVVGQKDNKAVLWKNGDLFILNDLIEEHSGWTTLSEANDINDLGQIVGTGWYQGLYKAFLLTPI